MSFLWRVDVHLVLLRLMRVTFEDDHGSVFNSLVGEVVRWNEKVDVVDVDVWDWLERTRRWCEPDVRKFVIVDILSS